jgi:triosephosphate isomerase
MTDKKPLEAQDVARHYAAAHAAHYTAKDLRKAISSYNSIIVAHSESREAGYSRTQILNIANSVLAKDVLLRVQMKLALAQLDHDRENGNARATPDEAVLQARGTA